MNTVHISFPHFCVFYFSLQVKKQEERKQRGYYRPPILLVRGQRSALFGHPYWLSKMNVQFSLQFNIQKKKFGYWFV